MSDGYEAKDLAEFDTFNRRLNELADNLRNTGDLVGSMIADPGLFGILGGQIIGAAASAYCGETKEAFDKYGEALERHKEKLEKARRAYEAQEDDASDSIARYQL